MAQDPTAAAPPPRSSRLRRIQRRIATIALVVAVTIAAGIGLLAGGGAGRLPELTPERFDEARAAWRSNRLANYDIEIEVDGPQPAVYAVRVRDGIPQQASRNGQPLTQPRTWHTWSVDGMFDTIASDVRHLRAEPGEGPQLQVSLGARFDPQHHYPARYRRVEQVRFGNNRTVTWRVTRFEPQTSGATDRASRDRASRDRASRDRAS